MAQIANTRKVFQFRLILTFPNGGIANFEAQKVTPPEESVDQTPHGDANHDIKTPGRVKIGDLVISKLSPATVNDRWAADMIKQAQDPYSGGGNLLSNFWFQCEVQELDSTQTAVLNREIYDECWVCKRKRSDYDRMSSDNIIEDVTLSVNKVFRA